MIELKGIIRTVVTENHDGHEKKVVTLQIGSRGVVFIQFQGRTKELVSSKDVDRKVTIKVNFNGKVSSFGSRFNNIIGKSIKTL